MKRPKRSATAKSVDKMPIKSSEASARWGAALSVVIVVLAYTLTAIFVRGCVHR